MRKWLLRLVYAGLVLAPIAGYANYQLGQCTVSCTGFASAVVATIHYAQVMLTDATGVDVSDTANHAIKVNVVAGGAGGGVVTQATGTNLHAVLDTTSTTAVTQPTAGNLNATVVGTGTFAAQLTGATNNINNIAGTVSLPTGAATAAGVATVNTTLGTPFQAGGSIGNTAFGLTAGASTTMQTAAVANGNGTNLTVTGFNTALVNVNCSVACSGGTTINFEGTDSTGTFFSVAALPIIGTTTAVINATTTGQFWVPVAGLTSIRARISAYSAGTITVTGTPMYGANAHIAQIANAVALGQAAMAASSPVVIANNQSNLPDNIVQFGGTNLSTGTGAGGAGIPRVTISNDSTLAANQSVNLAQVAGVATPVGSGVQATAPRTTLATDSPGIIATGGATTALSVPVALNSQYPVNSVTTAPTAITGNSTGTTGAVVGTLSAAASVTTYICGFNVQAIGGTATVGPITVAGLIGSSQVYQTDVNSATVGKQVAAATFSPCIPASAVNTAITITTTANGTATAVDVNSWGYRL